MNNKQLTNDDEGGLKKNPLFLKSDDLAKAVYDISYHLPKDELFGITSQLRRAVLSVPLNIIEGFARQSKNEFQRFLCIAYGSLKETKYLLFFIRRQNYINDETYKKIIAQVEEVARLLWVSIKQIKNR